MTNRTGECPVCGQRVKLSKIKGWCLKHWPPPPALTPCVGWGANPVTSTVLPAEGETNDA